MGILEHILQNSKSMQPYFIKFVLYIYKDNRMIKNKKPQITHNINYFKGVRDITLFSSQIFNLILF